jgi:murein L,D-transpeptidase YcbB/YkuD
MITPRAGMKSECAGGIAAAAANTTMATRDTEVKVEASNKARRVRDAAAVAAGAANAAMAQRDAKVKVKVEAINVQQRVRDAAAVAAAAADASAAAGPSASLPPAPAAEISAEQSKADEASYAAFAAAHAQAPVESEFEALSLDAAIAVASAGQVAVDCVRGECDERAIAALFARLRAGQSNADDVAFETSIVAALKKAYVVALADVAEPVASEPAFEAYVSGEVDYVIAMELFAELLVPEL